MTTPSSRSLPGRALAAFAVVAATSASLVSLGAPPASAASALDCTDAVYLTGNGPDGGQVLRVGLAAHGVGADSVYDPTTDRDGNPNQLGIDAGGARAVNVDRASNKVVDYDAAAGTVGLGNVPAGDVAGAVDPSTGLYYFGGYAGDDLDHLQLYVYDPTATGRRVSADPVADVATPDAPDGPNGVGNGDVAFDAAGHLFYVYSTATTSALYRLDVALPRSTNAATRAYTATEVSRGPVDAPVNGIAFGSDGYLYQGEATRIVETDPITGQPVPGGTIDLPDTVSSTDLASCAVPSGLTVRVSLPDGRIDPDDQFTTSFDGPSYATGTGPSGTTAGTDVGAQDAPAEEAGGLVLPGQDYTAAVRGTGSTDLDAYLASYRCTDDAHPATVVASGAGSAPTLAVAEQQSVTCVVTLAEPAPSVSLAVSVDPTTYDHAGQVLTYSYEVADTGNVALDDYAVTDALTGLSAIDCAPAQGTTLAVGDTATCTATNTVTRADVVAGAVTDDASVTADPPGARADPLSDAASAVATSTARAPSVTDDSATTPYRTPVDLPGATNDEPGQPSTPLVLDRTDFPATPQPDGAQVSTDQRTITLPGAGAYVLAADGTARFTPDDGFVGTTTVAYSVEDTDGNTAVGHLSVLVGTAPTTAPDVARTRQNVPVTTDVLGNDVPSPDADGGPGAWVPAGVGFAPVGQPRGAVVSTSGRRLRVPGEGVYVANPDGTITFTPAPAFSGAASPITYAATDSHDNGATSTLGVTVTAVTPVAHDDRSRTTHRTPVLVDVLADDRPGAGTPSVPLVPDSLRLVSPRTGRPAGRVVVRGEGVWSLEDDMVRFVPSRRFAGRATPLRYTVADANGTRATALVRVVVGPAGHVRPVRATTVAGRPVRVRVLRGVYPAPGLRLVRSAVCLLVGTATPAGTGPGLATATGEGCAKTYSLGSVGSWAVRGGGVVRFTPAVGFRGRAGIAFTVRDSAGTAYRDVVTVAVRRGTGGGSGTGTGTGTSGTASGTGSLADTGGPAGRLFAGAALLVVGGLLLLRRSSRRVAS